MGGLALQLPCWGDTPASLVVALPHRYERHPEDAYLLGAAGRLWAAGAPVDWEAVHAHERLRRVALPTYPFQRERFWVEPGSAAALAVTGARPGTAVGPGGVDVPPGLAARPASRSALRGGRGVAGAGGRA